MKKRILSILLACSLTAGLFAGCGSKDTDEESKKTEQTQEDSVDTEENADAEENDNTASENTEPEDGYYTITNQTLAERELHDFFQLYLGCWCYCAVGNDGTIPKNISTMLENTGVVGAIILDEGMRVVSDYNDSDFEGLSYTYELQTLSASNFKDINYRVSVNIAETNYPGNYYTYKKGTDAVIQVIANVTYIIESGNEQRRATEDYAVYLVNSNSNPEEWLIKEIHSAELTSNSAHTVEVWMVKNSSGRYISNWKNELTNGEAEAVSEENDWYEIVQAYKDYVSTDKFTAENYEFNFIYLNEDDIPDLVVCRTDTDKDWIYLLTYQDGEVHETSVFGDALYYKERESSIFYHTYGGTFEELVHTEVFAELADYEWVEQQAGEYTENSIEGGISGYKINGKECAEKAYKAHFNTSDMKLAWEELYLSVDEAFAALGLE